MQKGKKKKKKENVEGNRKERRKLQSFVDDIYKIKIISRVKTDKNV